MDTKRILLERVGYLIGLAEKSLGTQYSTEDSFFKYHWVSSESFGEFVSASLSFISSLYEEKHSYYHQFTETVKKATPTDIEVGKGILTSIKTEIDKGWLTTVRGLVSAEIFSDFLDAAEYLLTNKYKDPAAVIIGSTLEEHLRQLCKKYSISVDENRNGKMVAKKADTLNNNLYTSQVYNKLDQKNVSAWQDLRNKAAHGHYHEYTAQQVQNMLSGVTDFITRNPL